MIMEVITGKSNDEKIVVAQEIAFAKVLAGNNKVLRDRALKKLKKWLTVRGNGKWAFSEDEFIRIWTGLFYCMWMSDKFLVQEELAENISNLIHCFKKNSDNALLFIKCFNKRILMEWAGLDQYRIDKFHMLTRRFLRQTLSYCKEKNWDASLLMKLNDIYNGVVLHKDSSLGFVLHFVSIYAEELAKISNGKLKTETVLILIEPFVRLISKTTDGRILNEAEDFFNYLMKQTDVGIESEEQFTAWKQRGFPGEGPHSLKKVTLEDENDSDESDKNEEYDEEEENKPLDPRAGSVHVFLPQIPIDLEGILNLFKKYESDKRTSNKGRKRLRLLNQKFTALKKGKFPEKIQKDPVLVEKKKKRKQTKKNAKMLLEFREKLQDAPVKTKELKKLFRELEEQEKDEEPAAVNGQRDEPEEESEEKISEKEEFKEVKTKKLVKPVKNKVKEKKLNGIKQSSDEDSGEKENTEIKKKKKRKKKKKVDGVNGDMAENPKKKIKINGIAEQVEEKPLKRKSLNGLTENLKVTPVKKAVKRRSSNNWQVEELDSNSPEYFKIETPKIIKIERKLDVGEEEPESIKEKIDENEWKEKEEEKAKEVFPVFWEKAISKINKKTPKKDKKFLNPFAEIASESKSSNLRRISFALDKNMAQENEEYLEEVKNSPKVPFDGTKKPVQSALKSGLAPSPVNPFYRFKRIKF